MYFSNKYTGMTTPVYLAKALSVKEYAYFEDQNVYFRNTMEDGYFICDDILKDGKSGLFGVFDGHGGRDVAEYLLKNFQKEFINEYVRLKKDTKAALESTFINLDQQIKANCKSDEMGSTACVAFILYESGRRMLYVANVGDTRAVLGQITGSKRVSYDHRASDASEIQRIKQAGGTVLYNRVEGQLAVSRAFGDHCLKDKGVICNPYIEKIEVRVIDKFLVMGSDGLWDTVDDQESIDLIKNKDSAADMAKTLVSTALAKFSKDNVSCMVLKLN